MERHANFALVGAVSLALLIGALVFAVWLAEFQFNQKFDLYRIILRGPVSGLSRGGEVQLNGIKVGDIKNISLDIDDPNRVITDVELDHGTPIRVDTVAQLGSLGITGVKFVQLSPGTPSKPLLRKASRDRPPIIISKRSRMEDFVANTTELMKGANNTVNRLNAVLSDSNINTISHGFDDAGAVLAELRQRKALFAHLEATALELQMMTRSTRLALGDKDKGALKDMAQSVAELRATLAAARSTVGKLDGPLSELSSTTVPKLNDTLTSVQQAADSFNHLAVELRQDPRGMMSRQQGRQKELPR
jgi:phospholipid/cholesterol/gamma-HCH transport system substrate-binding protein